MINILAFTIPCIITFLIVKLILWVCSYVGAVIYLYLHNTDTITTNSNSNKILPTHYE